MEPLLDLRRHLLHLGMESFQSNDFLLGNPKSALEESIGRLWLRSAKLANDAGHKQSAWACIVKAKEFRLVEAGIEEANHSWSRVRLFAFIEQEPGIKADVKEANHSWPRVKLFVFIEQEPGIS